MIARQPRLAELAFCFPTRNLMSFIKHNPAGRVRCEFAAALERARNPVSPLLNGLRRGLGISNGSAVQTHMGPGLVAHVYNESTLGGLSGHMAIGHSRYST